MAKRFTDTEKWKKAWIRGLSKDYKIFWFYLLDDCNHAGIWEVDMEVARIRTGCDLDVDKAVEVFAEHVETFDGGKKWFVRDFVEFQYGELEPKNSMFKPVMTLLTRYGLSLKTEGQPSPTPSLKGGKEKEKVMVKVEVKEKAKETDLGFESFWSAYPKKSAKEPARKAFEKLNPDQPLLNLILSAVAAQSKTEQWLKGGKHEFVPLPTTWLNQRRWEDEVEGKEKEKEYFKFNGEWIKNPNFRAA